MLYLVERVIIQMIDNILVLLVQIRPDTKRSLVSVLIDALDSRIAQKRAEQARIRVVAQLEQKDLVELESGGKLARDLIDTVEPLQEDRTPLVEVVVVGRVAVALRELVAEHEPVDLDQRSKALKISIISFYKFYLCYI